MQTVFLTEFERSTRSETLNDIERARAELARLRALEQDVRWGRTEMDAEKAERLRQYLAGRSEISAGDELVLRSLRGKARERQRWMLGLPLLLVGRGRPLLARAQARLARLPQRALDLRGRILGNVFAGLQRALDGVRHSGRSAVHEARHQLHLHDGRIPSFGRADVIHPARGAGAWRSRRTRLPRSRRWRCCAKAATRSRRWSPPRPPSRSSTRT